MQYLKRLWTILTLFLDVLSIIQAFYPFTKEYNMNYTIYFLAIVSTVSLIFYEIVSWVRHRMNVIEAKQFLIDNKDSIEDDVLNIMHKPSKSPSFDIGSDYLEIMELNRKNYRTIFAMSALSGKYRDVFKYSQVEKIVNEIFK